MELIDFTNYDIAPMYFYGGGNGKKIGIKYNDEVYMLKFPSQSKNDGQSYSNSVFSEYIACHVFESLGFKTQKTLLGTYKVEDKEKIVCACKDFTVDNYELYEFAKLKNSILTDDSSSNGYGTDLEEVISTLQEQKLLPPEELINFFWDMFIVDALLGNFDRHNGNWGFLVNRSTNEILIAPIYDCGSCLYPQLIDNQMQDVLDNIDERDKRIYIFPNSAIKENNVKINYYNFINNLKNINCNEALLRIYPKIDLKQINNIIENTPVLSDIQKKFYNSMIESRYKQILEPAYTKLCQ